MKGLSRPLTPAAPRVNVAPARLSGFAFSLRVRWNQRPASTAALRLPARKPPLPIRGSQCHEDDVPSALRPEQCRAGGPVRLLREPTSPTVQSAGQADITVDTAPFAPGIFLGTAVTPAAGINGIQTDTDRDALADGCESDLAAALAPELAYAARDRTSREPR